MQMTKILFVCYGNICRSPMAEFLLRDLAEKSGLAGSLRVASAATSAEEIGNPVYPPARRKLAEFGISAAGKTAVQLTRQDYDRWDYLIGMEHDNLRNMRRILGQDPQHKLHLLLDFTDRPGEIDDPWYTGDFDTACREILRGCEGLLAHLRRTGALRG